MEDVYVIKVKTKPALSTLYPSERRYSASTVGGLSLVHLIFGSLALLLGIVARSVQGMLLFFCCLVPCVTGLLAWRRWYIDRNIAIFFYSCLFSALVAISCVIASTYDVYILTERTVDMIYEDASENWNETFTLHFNSSLSLDVTTLPSDLFDDLDIKENEFQLRIENSTEVEEVMDKERIENKIKSRLQLMVNVLVASLMEFVWSLVSVRIALRGMKSEFSEENGKQDDKDFKTTSPALHSRPDIILMNKHICCSMQSLDSLQSLNVQNVYPKLPLPESNREFKERVDKFLTNQIHQRAVSEVS